MKKTEGSKRVSILEAIFTFIIIGLLFCFLTWILFRGNLKFNIFTGFTIWGILYFFFLFEHFWINPEANTQVILQNYFQSQKKESGSGYIDQLEVPKGQRVCSTGWSPKRFFEYPVGRPIVTENREVKRTIEVRDKNNTPFKVSFRFFLRPIEGIYLTRYPLVVEDTAEDYFAGRFSSYIEGTFPDRDGDDILSHLEDSKSEFVLGLESLFDGSNNISDDEKRYARTIHDVSVPEIAKGASAQAAAQVKIMSGQIAEGVSELTGKGVDPDIAASIAAALAETKADIRIVGLTGASGLAHLVLGGDDTKGGGKTKSGK